MNPKILRDYHDELTKSLEGIKPENIVNYDESGFRDDPGRSSAIFSRTDKDHIKIIEHSKAGFFSIF